MSCGNSEIYSASLTRFFCGSTLLRYTSIVYDIIWNVKKEMPIGSLITGKSPPVTKLKYLKKNRSPRLKTTETHRTTLRFFSSESNLPSSRPQT